METRTVITSEEAKKLAEVVTGISLPFTLTWTEGAIRTPLQNSLIHKWFGEIARQQDDSAADVKGRCHVAYGVPIRLRDPVWGRVWEVMFAPLSYEQQCFLFAKGILSMTRDMTTRQLTEYMDAMQRDYLAQGVRLTIPEDA